MTQKIIYKTDDGGVAVISLSSSILDKYSINDIAAKEVPSGKPYKIVDETDMPSDRTFRDAWEVDASILTDGVGAEHDMFLDDPSHPNYVAPVEDNEND